MSGEMGPLRLVVAQVQGHHPALRIRCHAMPFAQGLRVVSQFVRVVQRGPLVAR